MLKNSIIERGIAMDFEDFIWKFFAILGLIVIICFIVFIIMGIPLYIQDTQATIKVKEKLAQDGIIITETQIQKILGGKNNE